MKVGISKKADESITYYTNIRNISFSPEVDFTGLSTPINQFTLDILTTDDITTNGWARLCDDDGNVYARYWIVKADRKSKNLVTILAQSPIVRLQAYGQSAQRRENVSASSIYNHIFYNIRTESSQKGIYLIIDSSIPSFNGFILKTTMREYLTVALMASQSYCKDWNPGTTHNNRNIEILPLPLLWSETQYGKILKRNQIFWKPQLLKNDPAETITITYYDFVRGDTGEGRTVKTAGGTVYTVIESEMSESSSSDGSDMVNVSNNMFVMEENASGILEQLKQVYFKKTNTAEVDIINNGEVWPGDVVTFPLYSEGNTMVTGYVNVVDFSFGNQIRSKLTLKHAKLITGVSVTIKWVCDGVVVLEERELYPDGYVFEIIPGEKQVLTNGHLFTYSYEQSMEEEASEGKIIEIPCDLISDQNLITGETTYPTSGGLTEE